MRKPSESAFTLVELLIVVVILGILAAVAIPQFSDSTEEARATNLQSNLAVMRNSIEFYRTNHRGKYPGYPSGGGAPTAAEATNQLIQASQANGATAAPGTAGYDYGPYIREQLPENPINGLNTILIVADAAAFPAADDTTGWIFHPKTGKLRANSTGTAPNGKNYYDF